MKISVIIPAYNAEKTIEKCLDSILNQTYNNLEIIVINDASTDRTLEILNNYKNDIKIITNNENKGIGASRNIGIENSTCDYISFIDSDDFIEPNMYEILKDNILDNDILIFNYQKVINEKTINNEYDFKNREGKFKNIPEILYNINLSPWNKLYRKELFKENLFPTDLKYEDAIVVVKAYLKASNIKIINNILYDYVVRNNSETTVVDDKVFDILKVSDLITKELKDVIDNEYLEAFMIRNLFRYTIQQKHQVNKEIKYKFVEDVFTFLNSNFPKWRKNKIYNKRNFIKKLIEKNKLLTKIYISL